MQASKQILFVSAGMLAPKKRDHSLARRQVFLNYGALSLATQLKRYGYVPALVHGNHDDPSQFVESLCQQGRLPTSRPLMLSIPSFYALEWSQQFCRLLKAKFPNIQIIAGGRWVVGPDPQWLKLKIPEVDLVFSGLAETSISNLVDKSRWPTLSYIDNAAFFSGRGEVPSFCLDHTIVDDFRSFHPSIEISRGCGKGCAFCEERKIKISKLRPPESLAQCLSEIIEQYGSEDIRPYFQASFFVPNPRWALRLHEVLKDRNSTPSWRCETRIDCLTSETIDLLARSGLRVIDFGLETASPQQILRMKKSRDPEKYLRRASDILKYCSANDISAKLNILLYAGETHATLRETTSWLKENAAHIKGVSVGPVVVFGPPKHSLPLIREMEALGARVADELGAEERGITHLHLSKDIDATTAEELSISISKEMMDFKSYFDLKAFSYYPRQYSFDQFIDDVRMSDSRTLPFDVSGLDSGAHVHPNDI